MQQENEVKRMIKENPKYLGWVFCYEKVVEEGRIGMQVVGEWLSTGGPIKCTEQQVRNILI